MADSIISLLAAARGRVVTSQNTLASSAVLSQPDSAASPQAIDLIYSEKIANPTYKLIDWLELAIADRIDAGDEYPVGSPDAYRGALYIAQMDITKFPNPMPRDFVLYIALARVAEGLSTSVKSVVQELISTYQFI